MSRKWADGPFPLIETPEFREQNNKTGKHDQYVRGASIMAVVHNVIIRSLNAIYLQAPHVKEKDIKDFLGFCWCWYLYIDNHHRGEETKFFPKLEEACGEKGLMDTNVEQHHEFEPSIEAFKTYLISLQNNEASFSAPKLLSIIDSFSTSLLAHLSDEIPTLLSLSRFGPKLPFLTLSSVEMRKASDELPKTEGVPFFLLNLDRTFEDGLWEYWPPIPAPVRWILIRVLARKNAGWWRFACCDYDGMPKNLYTTV